MLTSQQTTHDSYKESSTLFQFAVNKHGRNKNWDYETLTAKFENTKGTLQDLIETVSQGHALTAATFRPGARRAKANVTGAELWLLDIDNSDVLRNEQGKVVKDETGKAIKVYNPQLTIEEAKLHPFIQKHCLVAYTSVSHKPDWHKFRLILKLPHLIEDVAIIEAMARRLMKHLPHDPSCKDASRVFFGNTAADFFIVNPDADCLPNEWLAEATAAVQQQKLDEQRRTQKRLKWLESQDKSDIDSLVRNALSYIPPRSFGSGNYQECLTVLMALQSHYGWEAEAIAEQWSPSIKGTTWNIGRKLRSFKHTGKVSLGSLFHIAKRYGFKFPESKRQYQNNFGEPDPELYQQHLEQERHWEEVQELEAEHHKNNWFLGFCGEVKRRLFANNAKKAEKRAKLLGIRQVVQFYADKPFLNPSDYQTKEPPLLQYRKGERQKAWLSAKQAGWKFIIDRSQLGSGKSYDAGSLYPDENGTDKIWYFAQDHTNPTVETVERMANMLPRHTGLVIAPGNKTPLGNDWLRHPTPSDVGAKLTPSNCQFTDIFTTLSNKGYVVHNEKVVSADGKLRSSNPVCNACPDQWRCAKETDEGFGYKFERRSTMESRRIRAHLDSAPSPGTAHGEYDFCGDIAIVDEAGRSIRVDKSVETDLSKLSAEWSYVEQGALSAFEQLREFRLTLNRVFQGEASNDPRFGANHQAIAAFLPPLPANYKELIEQVKAALPLVSDLVDEPDSVEGLGGEFRRSGNYVRSKMRQEARADFVDKVHALPPSVLLHALEIWAGGHGAMRCHHGTLSVTVPSPRHADILKACNFTILLDGTANKECLALKLGIDPNQILEVEQASQPLTNLKVINVNVAGLGSGDISDSAKQRVLALIKHLAEKHETQIKVIALKRDRSWLEVQSGHWFADSRGSNRFKGEEVMASINTPRINLGAAQDEYICLHGSLDGFEAHYQMLIEEEQAQCITGRQRAHLEPTKQFWHYAIGTNQDLDFLAEQYGCEVVNVEGVELCPEAGTKGQQTHLRLVEAATQLLDRGSKLTQVSLGEFAAISQAAISKIASRFGSWQRFKKILLVLCGLYRDGYIFTSAKIGIPPDLSELTEEEREWAIEFLPGLAETLSGTDLGDALSEVAQVFNAETLGRILHFTPHWVKTKLLVAMLCLLPKWAADEFLSNTLLELNA